MIPPMPHDLPEPRLKPNTEVVLQKRYLHKKADGSTETPAVSLPTQEQVEQAAGSLYSAASTVLDAILGASGN